MNSPYQQHTLLRERMSIRPGMYVPERPEAIDVSEEGLRTELRALRRTNDRLREQNAELLARNEELDAFAHTVAHDLKNPLCALIVTSGAISDITDLTPRELLDFMNQIQSSAFEMNGIIASLLLLAEVRTADVPAEPVDMAEVVEHIRRRLNILVRQNGGRIISPEAWPDAIGYAPWIEEVWANYISNALKYGGHPPVVELGASLQPAGMIRFWVRDNGGGLPPRALAQLFTPIRQVGQARRSGHGLGLSIVRRIVEKMGGRVGVESEAGRGCLFYFTLPAAREPVQFGLDEWESPSLESIQVLGGLN